MSLGISHHLQVIHVIDKLASVELVVDVRLLLVTEESTNLRERQKNLVKVSLTISSLTLHPPENPLKSLWLTANQHVTAAIRELHH